MRYMVFNLLVVGALAFLLFDGEPPATVRHAVDKVAAETDRIVEKGRSLVGQAKPETAAGLRPAAGRAPEERAVTALLEPAARPPRSDTAQAAAAPSPAPKATVATPPKPVAKPRPPAAAAPPSASKPAAAPSRPESVTAATRPRLDPEVAKRRAEVLGTGVAGAQAAASRTATAATSTSTSEFMAPRVRRSELQKLAEDMELMFVEKVAR